MYFLFHRERCLSTIELLVVAIFVLIENRES